MVHNEASEGHDEAVGDWKDTLAHTISLQSPLVRENCLFFKSKHVFHYIGFDKP